MRNNNLIRLIFLAVQPHHAHGSTAIAATPRLETS